MAQVSAETSCSDHQLKLDGTLIWGRAWVGVSVAATAVLAVGIGSQLAQEEAPGVQAAESAAFPLLAGPGGEGELA